MTTFTNGYFSESKIDTDLAAFLVEAMQEGHGSPGATDEAIARDMKRIMHTLIKQTENVRTGAISLVDSDADGQPDQFKVIGGDYEFEGTTKTLATTANINPTDNDTTYVWIDSANTVQTAIDGTGWPTLSHLKLAEITVDAAGAITDYVDRRPLLHTLADTATDTTPGAISLVDTDADGLADQFKILGGSYNFEGTAKTLATTANINPTDNDVTYVWIDSANAVQTAVDGAGWPVTPHLKLAEATVDAIGVITATVDRRPGLRKLAGHIPIPMASLREVVANDIDTLGVGLGSLLAKDSTPIFEFINLDTDSCHRLHWVAGNVDPVTFQAALPPDMDTSGDLVLHARFASSGTTDAVGFDLDTFFNEGDTKIEDVSATNQTTTYADKITTIAAADIPTGAQVVSMELTPVTHATDAIYLTGLWLEYAKS